ncbi:MAG: hypothetical protein GX055_02590 [Desulfovibrionales bacterium]|nr:hypothetical protein [Desulfovibrionales bacterium]
MQKIPLNLAGPDMVLAKPVTRDTGMVLIAAGTVLTESLIMRLENMGIEQIVVEGTPVDMGDGAGDEAQAKKLERLDHLFRNFADDTYMQKIKALVRAYYMGAVSRSAGPRQSGGM